MLAEAQMVALNGDAELKQKGKEEKGGGEESSETRGRDMAPRGELVNLLLSGPGASI